MAVLRIHYCPYSSCRAKGLCSTLSYISFWLKVIQHSEIISVETQMQWSESHHRLYFYPMHFQAGLPTEWLKHIPSTITS